jgi:hypothetical protein
MDIEDKRFLDNVPDWLRWLLCLPLSVAAYFAAYYLCINLNQAAHFLDYNNNIQLLFVLALARGWSAATFIWVGATIAPQYNFSVSIIMSTIYVFCLGFIFAAKLIYGDSLSSPWVSIIIMIITGAIAVIGVSLYFKGKNNPGL